MGIFHIFFCDEGAVSICPDLPQLFFHGAKLQSQLIECIFEVAGLSPQQSMPCCKVFMGELQLLMFACKSQVFCSLFLLRFLQPTVFGLDLVVLG
jgi:hypothetical protein